MHTSAGASGGAAEGLIYKVVSPTLCKSVTYACSTIILSRIHNQKHLILKGI